jgi:hypothetical protein
MSMPAQIILETDMSADVDDAGALAVLHRLADLGECEILACLVNGRDVDKATAATVRAVNGWYGRPGIPVGTYQGDKGQPSQSSYTAGVRDRFLPQAVPDDREPRALDVFRQALEGAPDGGVTVVSIGFLMNLRDLLESEPDCISPLDGGELIRRKVARMVLMGGQFPASDPVTGEYNFAAHGAGPDTQFVVEHWPTPILFSGFEIGDRIITSRTLPQTSSDNPVRLAYELYNRCEGRASFDQTAILAAVRPPELYWDVVGPGRCVVAAHGSNTWSNEPHRHSYLVAREAEEKMAAVIDDLMARAPNDKFPGGGPH